MKKYLLAAVLSLLVAVSAKANTYVDNNPANVFLNIFNPSYTGTFTLAGYDPTLEEITSATATFTFGDVVLRESFTIYMDGVFATQGSFFGLLPLSNGVFGAALLDLSADGVLSYTITRTSGAFWLLNARLEAESRTLPVPDTGATVALLGASCFGLLGLRRKLAA